MKTTRYFDEQVRRKRPYIDSDWCVRIVANPLHREAQSGGRIRFWGEILLEKQSTTLSSIGDSERTGHETSLLPRNR